MPTITAEMAPKTPARRGFSRFWLALKQLFHELVGALFAVLAFFWAQNAFRAWSRDGARWLIGTAAFLTLLMAAFSFTSFRKARRLQTS